MILEDGNPRSRDWRLVRAFLLHHPMAEGKGKGGERKRERLREI
jgi:hypothetical protein